MILITGATGTVGSEVLKRSSTQGIQVRAVTRDPRKVEASRLPHVEFVQGDFEDVDSMRRACSGVYRAFLLTNSTERAQQQQIAFTRVAQESGVRHIVKLSQLHADVSSPGRSWDAVRAFAGEDFEAAVVPPKARALLARFDERSQHYEIREESVVGGEEGSRR